MESGQDRQTVSGQPKERQRDSLGEKLASDMTIREKFAAMAMQALIPTYVEQVKELENAAGAAVEYADALLKELEKETK